MNYSNLRNEIDRRVYNQRTESESDNESHSESDNESHSEVSENSSESDCNFESVSDTFASSAESEDTLYKRFEKFSNMESALGVSYPKIDINKLAKNSLSELKDGPSDIGKFATMNDIEEPNYNVKQEPHEKSNDKEVSLGFANSSNVNEFVIGVDSTFKENLTTTTSEIVWQFEPIIKNIIRLEIESIEFPNTFYSFSKTKGNTTIRIDSSLITIDDGNYDISGIVSVLNSALTTSGITDMSFGYNQYSHRIKLNNSGTHSVYFADDRFSDRVDDWGLGYYLGFRNKSYVGITSSITASSHPNMTVDTYVLLKIDDYNNYQQYTWHNIENAFCKIQLTVPKGSIQYVNTANLFSKFYVFNLPTHLNKWIIRVVDKYGELLELADSKFSFSMKISQINNSKIYDSYRTTLLKD